MKPLRIKNLVLGQGIPNICIPMTGKNEEELLKELAYIREFTPDLVEWRVDCLKNQESMWEMLKDNKRQFRRNSPFIYLPHSRRGWLPGNYV